MIVGVAPVYIEQSFRFVKGIGPKSIAALAQDTGISIERLTKFQDDKHALLPEECVTVWSVVFQKSSFLEATAQMDALKL